MSGSQCPFHFFCLVVFQGNIAYLWAEKACKRTDRRKRIKQAMKTLRDALSASKLAWRRNGFSVLNRDPILHPQETAKLSTKIHYTVPCELSKFSPFSVTNKDTQYLSCQTLLFHISPDVLPVSISDRLNIFMWKLIINNCSLDSLHSVV